MATVPRNCHKKTPFPGQGPYNPPPPYKWIETKIIRIIDKSKKNLNIINLRYNS